VLGTQKFITEILQPFLRHTGPSLSPMNAWVLLKGLETLELRVTRQAASAEAIARKLSGHAKLAQVLYPTLEGFPQRALAQKQMSGGGTMVGFTLKGGKPAAFKFLNALDLVLISNNLGDAKSLATHPMTTTHQRLTAEQRAAQGIDDGLIRVSVGLEDVDDLIEDIEKALSAV
jgi:O-succinylhomoserine sulfhydrylase